MEIATEHHSNSSRMAEYCLMIDGPEGRRPRPVLTTILVASILVPYIGIAILFGLYGSLHKRTSSYAEYNFKSENATLVEVTYASSASALREVSQQVVRSPVSLTSSGKLQLGSGVTTASLTVPYPLYGIKTLSQGNGIFVGIFQDFDDLSNTANVVAGKVSVDGKSIALGNTALYEPEVKDFSVDPRITRLSDNTFALSYFQYIGVSGVYTRFGVVDPISLNVTVSDASRYSNNTYFSVSHEVVGLNANTYLLLYFDADTGSGPLTVRPVSLVPSSPGVGGLRKVFGVESTLQSSALKDNMYATRINNSTAAVVFLNAKAGNVLTVVLLELNSFGKSAVVSFGSSINLGTGTTLTEVLDGYTYMDIDIEPMAATNASNVESFVVLYSDVSNNGKMTSAYIEITKTNELVRKSPNFILSKPNPNLNKYYSWGALAASSSGHMAMVYSRTSRNCSVDATTEFSVLETKPSSYGVISAADAQGNIKVAASGVVSGYSGLKTGAVYYSDSRGALVNSGLYHGSAPVASSVDEYVQSADGSKLLSANGLVGTAVSPTELYI